MNRLLYILVPALWLTGCFSAEMRVVEQLPNIHREWQTQVRHQANLQEKTVGWSQAVTQLQVGNLKWRTSRHGVASAKEAVRQVYRDLRPSLNVQAGLSRPLLDLPGITSKDLSFSADSFITLPGVVGFNARKFAADLSLMRAQVAEQIQKRTQVVELYKLTLRAGVTRQNLAMAQQQQVMAQRWEALDPVLGRQTMAELRSEETQLELEAQQLQDQIGELLGNRNYRWKIETNSLPVLSNYEQFELQETSRVGRLQLLLTAIELAGAKARLQGIRLYQWPDLHLYISGPPIYQRSAGTQHMWDAGQVRANANLFWQIDTRGQIASMARGEKQQQALQRARIRLEAQGMISKLLAAKRMLAKYREEEARLTEQTRQLAEVPAPLDFRGWQQLFNSQRVLARERQKLFIQSVELKILFWVIDDESWQ